MTRPPRTLPNAATIAPLALLLALGCASPPRPNPAGDHRLSLAPSGRLRFDGVYECRGIKLLARNYFSGVPQPELEESPCAIFLRFAPDGNAFFLFDEEPRTTDDAARELSSSSGRVDRGRYTVNGSDLTLTIDVQQTHPRPTTAKYTGRVYADRLELRLAWQSEFDNVRQQYQFVPWEPAHRP